MEESKDSRIFMLAKSLQQGMTNHPFVTQEMFVASVAMLLPLLDNLANVVFFVKDDQARYQLANKTLLTRCNLCYPKEIIGFTSEQIFLTRQGRDYTLQDVRVLKEGKVIKDNLELHSYASGRLGWCITNKIPIYGMAGNVVAMAGISVDIDEDNERILRRHARLAAVAQFVHDHLDQKINIIELAELANLSLSQLERTFKAVLHMSPLQFVQKLRLEHAIMLLANPSMSITKISLSCGYNDHSAFSRQFKQFAGMSPSQFRQVHYKHK